jgi:hypothetical protein
MPGLEPGIYSVTSRQAEASAEWIAGSSPAMTTTSAAVTFASVAASSALVAANV